MYTCHLKVSIYNNRTRFLMGIFLKRLQLSSDDFSFFYPYDNPYFSYGQNP